MQKLREAARVFVDAMLPGDGIGIVRFDDTVQRLMELKTWVRSIPGPVYGSARPHRRYRARPCWATSIGGGVAEGKAAR